MGVGVLLSIRAAELFRSMPDEFSILTAALLAGSVLAFYGALFRKVVAGVARRIRALPSETQPWRFLNRRAIVLVGGMVLLGYVLRTADLPPVFLAYPYAAMGGALLIGGAELILRRGKGPVVSDPSVGKRPTSEEGRAR